MSWRPLASVLVFVLGWEIAGHMGWLNPVLLSHPSEIWSEAIRLFRSAELASDTFFTLKIFAASFAIAWLVGVGLGFAMGYSSLIHDITSPFVVVANGLPKIVLMPLLVLWLGIGTSANVFLGSMMASFPILQSVRAGVKSLDPDLVRLGRVHGASPTMMLRHIILPGITPYVLSGMRVAISYGMVGVLIAEFFGASQGLGYRMVLYSANFQVPAFFVCICMVALATLTLSGLVHLMERRTENWRPSPFQRPGL